MTQSGSDLEITCTDNHDAYEKERVNADNDIPPDNFFVVSPYQRRPSHDEANYPDHDDAVNVNTSVHRSMVEWPQHRENAF